MAAIEKVAVVGLGIIGSRVAANYQKSGYQVKVWNRTPKPDFPGWEPNLGELAAWADVIQFFVRDHEALLSTLASMETALGANPGKIAINSATVSLAATLEAQKLVEATGCHFLDAPFTGSREAAANAKLAFYIAGAAAPVAATTPLLLTTATSVTPSGEIGTATVLKVATNMVSAVTVQVLSEALALCRAANLPEEAFEAAMAVNASGSALAKMKLPTMRAGDYETHFSLKNMLKDSRYALELAKEYSLTLPVLTETSSRMEQLTEAGRGEQDYSALYEQFPKE